MKPFDLHAALNGSCEVVTKDGRPVTQMVLFRDVMTQYPLHGVCEGCILSWMIDGSFGPYWRKTPREFDLFMADAEPPVQSVHQVQIVH